MDHVGDCLTIRSHIGVLVVINLDPIFWYSKIQATIDSATFGLELVSMHTFL